MNIINNYQKALQDIYDHVGFKEDWVIAPLDDCTETYWNIIGDSLKYAKSIEQFNSAGDFYLDEIYKQRFYDKWVYEGKDFTMVFCDPHVDGMKWFRIFDNKKRINEFIKD